MQHRSILARPEDLILADYDAALAAHGDNAAGALWPNEAGRLARFDVMLDLLGRDASRPVVLCDLACGTGELVAHSSSTPTTAPILVFTRRFRPRLLRDP